MHTGCRRRAVRDRDGGTSYRRASPTSTSLTSRSPAAPTRSYATRCSEGRLRTSFPAPRLRPPGREPPRAIGAHSRAPWISPRRLASFSSSAPVTATVEDHVRRAPARARHLPRPERIAGVAGGRPGARPRPRRGGCRTASRDRRPDPAGRADRHVARNPLPELPRRDEAVGGAALGLAVMAKLWPLALAPVLVIRRAWRPAVAGFAVVVVVLGAAWYLTGGPKGPFQVLTSAGVRGWHVQSTVGSVLWIAGRGIPVVEADALRVGSAAPWMKGLLFLGLLVCEVAIWRRAAGTDRDPSGGAALAAVVALTVFSPQSSLQYAVWFLPWTALAFEGDGEERTATIGPVAVALTGLIALAWPDQIVVPSGWVKLLVLARNAAAVGLLISWFAAMRTRAPRQSVGAPVSV